VAQLVAKAMSAEVSNAQPPGSAPHVRDWSEQVRAHRDVWKAKPILRRVYRRWYDRIRRATVPGRTLEVGGGSGNFKEYWPELVSSDVVKSCGLDLRADCLALPFQDDAFDNVVGVDILHHLFDPDTALREIARVTRPGGRAVFVEPYVSWFSRLVRGRYHHERQDLSREAICGADKKPDEANLAIPTLLFIRRRREFERRFPMLRLLSVRLSDILAYPLTGGFGRRALLPGPILSVLYHLERGLWPLRRCLAFKMLVALEVLGDHSQGEL